MIDKNSKISFVMPAYNSAETIGESVESIFNGNFESGDEVIIVNDCSSDDTEKIIADLLKKYPGIIYVKNEANRGCPASRNIGIDLAKNRLIFNLDSDNILTPGSVKKLKNYLCEQNADIAAFSQYHYFVNDTKKITHKWIYDSNLMTLADFLAGPVNPGPGGNFLFTKQSWKKIGGYWEYGKGLHEAWGFTLKQLANKAKFVVAPNSFYFHRHGHDSLFVSESRKKNESSAMATKMILNFADLINDEDLSYIKSEVGDITWFENFFVRPIRLKSGEIGKSGHIEKLEGKFGNRPFAAIIKRRLRMIKKALKFCIDYFGFIGDFSRFKKIGDRRLGVYWRYRNPQLRDKTPETSFDTHYIYHPAWAARIVKKINPDFHVDISSTLTFSSMLSAFIPVRFYDYRPANLLLGNLHSDKANLMSLPFADDSVKCLSCMHTVEHIGLGRYGDPLDPEGDIKAINELKRVTAREGSLIFVVPIGKPKLAFNAHRIYSYDQIMNYFSHLKLEEFSLIPDNALKTGIIYNASKELSDHQNYGCGLFWFKKI